MGDLSEDIKSQRAWEHLLISSHFNTLGDTGHMQSLSQLSMATPRESKELSLQADVTRIAKETSKCGRVGCVLLPKRNRWLLSPVQRLHWRFIRLTHKPFPSRVSNRY